MLSRTANDLYWMSRYAERAENTTRFINANLSMILDMPSGTDEQWEPLVITTGDHQSFLSRYDGPTKENVLSFLVLDQDNPNSIKSSMRMARENARSVREVISSELWEQINRFYLYTCELTSVQQLLERGPLFFIELLKQSYLFTGTMDATMSRNEGYYFARLGRMLERADKTTRIVDVKYYFLLPSVTDIGTPIDVLQWIALLHSASAFEMFHKVHQEITPANVVKFLILDREFPRSVHHCITDSDRSLHIISGSPEGGYTNMAEKLLGQLRADLDYLGVEEMMASGLHSYLDNLESKMNQVSDAVFEAFFSLQPG